MELRVHCSQSWRIMQGNMATNISCLVQQMNILNFMKKQLVHLYFRIFSKYVVKLDASEKLYLFSKV